MKNNIREEREFRARSGGTKKEKREKDGDRGIDDGYDDDEKRGTFEDR